MPGSCCISDVYLWLCTYVWGRNAVHLETASNGHQDTLPHSAVWRGYRGACLLPRWELVWKCAPNTTFIWHILWCIALSGLATHLSHNVCFLLVCSPQNWALIVPSCWVNIADCEAEILTFLPSCVGSLYVVAVVGSMALVLANCKIRLGLVVTSTGYWLEQILCS